MRTQMRLPVQCLTPVRDYQPPGRFGPDNPGETHRRWLRYTPRLIVHVKSWADSGDHPDDSSAAEHQEPRSPPPWAVGGSRAPAAIRLTIGSDRVGGGPGRRRGRGTALMD